MTPQNPLSMEAFLRMAEAAGMDVKDPHIEDLYAYVQGVLQGVAPLRRLDLSGVEPDFLSNPQRG